MKREVLVKEINKFNNELSQLGVLEIIISRECLLEEEIDCTIPIIVRLKNDDYLAYNLVQEFLSKNIYEHIEVIPYDSYEAKIDDHFDKDSIKIQIKEENI